MDDFGSILQCEACGHGAGFHDGSGCAERSCRCALTRSVIVDAIIAAEYDEHRSRWRPEPQRSVERDLAS